jgi:hypothetical protein
MLTMQRGAFLLLGVAVLGCEAVPDRVLAPDRDGVSGPSLSPSGVQQRVTGHANIFLPSFQAEERYSQSAIRHADGSVTGEFELHSEQDAGIRVHGDVTCFTIVGNTARLGGVIERSDTPGLAGAEVVWTVVDNGEGDNDPPDLTSDFFLVGSGGAQFHCAVGFAFAAPVLPVLSGNLQVHP